MSSIGFRRNRADLLCLCYHAVSSSWPAELSVTPDALAEQLRWLSERGYRATTFSTAVREPQVGRQVAITFDDGYASTLEVAAPLLEQYGMVATLFVPTDFIGAETMAWPGIEEWVGTEHERELHPLGWDGVRELVDAGWEIGSHTRSHPHLSEVSELQLDDELAGSKHVIEEELGQSCTSLAYPFGDFDDRAAAGAERAGYEVAASFPSRLVNPKPFAWPRVGVFHGDSLEIFRIKASPTVRRMRGFAGWDPLIAPFRKLRGMARG